MQMPIPRRIVRALKKTRREAQGRLKDLRRRLLKDDRFQIDRPEIVEAVAWPKRHSSRKTPPVCPVLPATVHAAGG